MKYLFVMTAVVISLLIVAVPAQAQAQYPSGYYGQPQGWHGVMSADDQQHFDKYYAKWLDDTHRNDRDDIAKDAQHMQEIMARYNIPAGVPFDQVASNAVPGVSPAYGQVPAYGQAPAYGQVRLSPDDQREFDKDYGKWVEATRKNDLDDVDKDARKMQEIMARYNIPPNVPFQAIATNGYAAGPNGVYPYNNGYAQPAQRLSDKDQKDFDKAYRKWLDAKHKKDMDDVDHNARKMQNIMARYNIPANVPFDRIASPYNR